jgi:hypothetical protein
MDLEKDVDGASLRDAIVSVLMYQDDMDNGRVGCIEDGIRPITYSLRVALQVYAGFG